VSDSAGSLPQVQNPLTLLRSRSYLALLLIAAVLGVPISVVAYYFLQLTTHMQTWLFTDLPKGVGFHGVPTWWPAPVLAVGGLLVALTIRYLPGKGGASPADGFKVHGAPTAIQLPSVILASVLTLGFGAVLGPEAPLIAIGAGLAAWSIRLIKRGANAQAVAVVGAAGSFAAISTLLGSPLLGAFLLMEASGLGGATASLVLVPGLLSAGIGSLVFIGLDSLTGLGKTSLSIPNLPPFTRPDVAEFGWAFAIGLAAAIVGLGIHRLGLWMRTPVERRLLIAAPIVGLIVAGLAIAYFEGSGHPSSEVLFSGQADLGPLILHSSAYTAGALALLVACKSIAYGASLSTFRGGPIFPAMFIGGAGGILMSHLPGLPLVPAVAMGIGAMCVSMLRLPFTSVLLATLLLYSDGVAAMPLVILAVVVAHVASAHLNPVPDTPAPAAEPAPPAPAGHPNGSSGRDDAPLVPGRAGSGDTTNPEVAHDG
jgi:H+/Cl- antiporter ClcA